MEFIDRQIACLDCSQPFVFSASEQEFYSRKGFQETPKRCKPCRDMRKLRRGPDGGVGAGAGTPDDKYGNGFPPGRGPGTPVRANGNGGNSFGNDGSILGNRGNGNGATYGADTGHTEEEDDDIGNRMPPQPGMASAPPPRQQPRAPQREQRDPRPPQVSAPRPPAPAAPPQRARPAERERGEASRGGQARERELFEAVCAQCKTATKVPFKPVAGRPVYCKDCYGNRSA